MQTLPTAPPYGWAKTYTAATKMANHLPELPLDSLSLTVENTPDGLAVFGGGSAEAIARVVVEPASRWQMPLQAGDPVVLRGVPGRPDLEEVAAELLKRGEGGDKRIVATK